MATSVEFDAAARAEFDEAFNWYAERSPGTALGFATEVDVAIESIAADPDRFQQTDAIIDRECPTWRILLRGYRTRNREERFARDASWMCSWGRA